MKMKAYTTYKIYPKAIEEFIKDHYDLNTINFGNIENNVKAILQKLKLDTQLECEWDITPMYFFDKVDISRKYNKPSDFDQYSNFTFAFTSKTDKKTTKEYEKAIETLEDEFIVKYQDRIKAEYKLIKKQEIKIKKKRERLIYIASALIFTALATFVIVYKSIQN
ncbi:hypothetical protein KH5_06060 [Urechidicola sp. KH5]